KRLAVEARTRVRRPLQRPEFVNPTVLEKTIGNELVAFLVAIEFHVREGGLAARFAKVIANLVLQDADEPTLLRAAPCELVAAFERRQKGFLHHVLSFCGVP